MSVTNHFAETAVPGQLAITVRAAHGELEIAQEYDGEWHGIFVQPPNVLLLIRAMLRIVGLEHAKLYIERPGGACHDVDWPEGPLTEREHEMIKARPDIDWHEAMRDFGDLADKSTDAKPRVKDRTAAERQRRHRAKKNKAKLDSDTVTVTSDERDADRDAPRLGLVA